MANEFANEFTVLLWPKLDRNYLQGHAALKITKAGKSVVLNAEDGNGVDYRAGRGAQLAPPGARNAGYRAGLYQQTRALAERNERQRPASELESLAATAPIQLSLPMLGGDGPHWGLPPAKGDFEYYVKENRLNLHQLSTTRIAWLLDIAGLGIYAQSPAQHGAVWSVEQVRQWVRAGRSRIDHLNRTTDDFLMTMQLEYGKGYHLRDPVTQLMSVDEWRVLSSDGNFIRGNRTQKLDRLVAEYHRHQAFDRDKLKNLIPIFEACVEYRTESRGSRTNAAMQLGKQVLSVLRAGLKRESLGATTDLLKEMGIT